MPTNNLDSIIRTWTRANPVDLDFESMFATVISEHMTQNNLDLAHTLMRLGLQNQV